MAPGFRIQDIVQVSQLSYKLYNASTSDQGSAIPNTEELNSELFALHCALSHLRHVAHGEARNVSSEAIPDQHRHRPWQSLEKLVADCATTLRDLELSMNSNGLVEEASSNHTSDCGSQLLAKRRFSALESPHFSVSEGTTENYRDRLRSHNDAINVVLNAFCW